jgi:N-acetylglucosamine-6-sulfatase
MAARRTVLAVVGGALALAWLAACAGDSSPTAGSPVATPSPRAPRPNLVVVVTDDLDVPTTRMLTRLPDLMTNQGLSFTHAYVSESLCAPSRASILTGRYPHNTGVIDNEPPQGFVAFRPSEGQSLGPWMKAAGYHTALIGKYINGYAYGAGDGYIPPGWDEWFGHLSAMEDGRYFNYWVNDNGNVVRYGGQPEDYSADVETQRAVKFVRDSAGRPEPLFLYLGTEAPHIPALYAARFGADFRYALAPRCPSFNESDVSQKPSWVRGAAPMTDADIDAADRLERFRLRSVEAVEDMIGAVLQALDETGRLATTYVFFTSDNGMLMGQHRAVAVKDNGYEESIGVPLIVRGPGVPVGQTDAFVHNVDLAPTLLDLAGAPIPDSVDGLSFAPFLHGKVPGSWRSEVMVEDWGSGPSYTVRNADWMYNHQDTEDIELYDMRADPYQLHNLRRSADPAVLSAFEDRIHAFLACHGVPCRK